jgi:hypothetical protein
MRRLVDQAEPGLDTLTELVRQAEPYRSNPFAKRLVQSRLARALDEGHGVRRPWLRPAFLGGGILLLGATAAAAAGYGWLAAPSVAERVEPPQVSVVPPPVAPRAVAPAAPAAPEIAPEPGVIEKPSDARPAKPRPGEDPTQVAEAVRALRKQGDPARAQALLDQYLKSNPRGALSEDALALSIEAAVARKDPRAADYARRYLARYPNGRFRAQAERALAR